jgi:hypothetical protein
MFEDIQTMNCAQNNIRVHFITWSVVPKEQYEGSNNSRGNSRALT